MQTLAQQRRIMSACQQRWEDPDDYYDDDDEPEENPECPKCRNGCPADAEEGACECSCHDEEK